MHITIADAYRLAALASVDYRTAMRALKGESIKGLAGERLVTALASFRSSAQPDPLAISSVNKPQA